MTNTNETLERQVIDLIAADRIFMATSSIDNKLKRIRPKLARAVDLTGNSYSGERVFANVANEEGSKARGMKYAIDAFSRRHPNYGAELRGLVAEQRTFAEPTLYFGMQEGRRLTADDYLGVMANLGKMIAKWQIKKNGFKAKSPLLDKLSFGKFNSYFKPNRTPFDWLSTNDENVDRYIADPYCGSVFSAGFFYDLIIGVKKVNLFENIEKISGSLPIFLISGEKDPVGNFTKGVLKVFNDYEKAKLNDVSCKFYTGFRHEILKETNRLEVYNDIAGWLNKHIK